MHISNRQLFLNHVAQTSDAPLMLEISHAKGNYLFDASGKKYLDLISGISVASFGHGNKKIVEAVKNQADKHMHTMVYGEMIQQPQVELATLLVSLLPESLNSVYFVNSGTEAAEGAMKLAKRVTGRKSFTALTQAYHGSTQGALSLMSDEYYTSAFRPLLPDIRFLNQNDMTGIDENITQDTAAVFIELIQSEKGAVPCTKEFINAIRNRCDITGSLLVIDEIQTGMGRTGSLFLIEQYNIIPDILLLGKAFGGGMPLAAFVSNKELMDKLSVNPVLGHITTFGGHPVSCAAGLAGLKIINEQPYLFRVAEKEALFRKLFKSADLPEPEGVGLLLSLNLQTFERCMGVIRKCLEKGLFTDWFLFAPHKLRIAPPLNIEDDEIQFAVNTITEAVREFDFGGIEG